MSIARKAEAVETGENDKPTKSVTIIDCGQVADEEKLTEIESNE